MPLIVKAFQLESCIKGAHAVYAEVDGVLLEAASLGLFSILRWSSSFRMTNSTLLGFLFATELQAKQHAKLYVPPVRSNVFLPFRF